MLLIKERGFYSSWILLIGLVFTAMSISAQEQSIGVIYSTVDGLDEQGLTTESQLRLLQQATQRLERSAPQSRFDFIVVDEPCENICVGNLIPSIEYINASINSGSKHKDTRDSVDLLLNMALISGGASSKAMISVNVIDPMSVTLLASYSFPLLSVDNVTNRTLDEFSQSVLKTITDLSFQTKIIVSLSGFTVDELVPLTTFLLSMSEGNQIQLIETFRQQTVLTQIFPIIESSYALTSDQSVSTLYNELTRFWRLQDIDVDMRFSQENLILQINRMGNPYTPSVIVWLLIAFSLIFISVGVIQRNITQNKLATLAENKHVDEWLEYYRGLTRFWLRPSSQWRSQLNYWQQIKKESAELEKQAKIFFDAGDVNTSKIFISKALNLNATAPIALNLVGKIKELDKNIEQMGETEQWLRNKIAKAMSNFRNNKVHKSLKQAYQAERVAEQHKSFKKQLRAIRKLLKKVLQESSVDVIRASFVDPDQNITYRVCAEDSIFLGRDDEDFSDNFEQGIVLFNHKAISRLGRQNCITNRDGTFEISDLNSTNGSYLQVNTGIDSTSSQSAKKLETKGTKILQSSTLWFGEPTEKSSIHCHLTLSPASTTLTIQVKESDYSESSKSTLVKYWSDFFHACQQVTLFTKKSVVIVSDKRTTLVCSSDSVPKHMQRVAKVEFGDSCFITPSNNTELWINGERTVDKVPLFEQCEIVWDAHKLIFNIEKSREYRQFSHNLSGY